MYDITLFAGNKQKQDDGESSEDETQFKILYGRVHPVRPAGSQAAPAAVKGVIPAPDWAVAATPASVDDNPTTQAVANEAAKEKKQPKGGMAWEVCVVFVFNLLYQLAQVLIKGISRCCMSCDQIWNGYKLYIYNRDMETNMHEL